MSHRRNAIATSVNYSIQIPDELDHLVRQMCDSREKRQSKAVSPEEFLSAFLEEKLNELFARRERPENRKKQEGCWCGTVRQRTRQNVEGSCGATHTALEALRKLVAEATMEPKRIRRGNRVNSLNFHAEAAHGEVK